MASIVTRLVLWEETCCLNFHVCVFALRFEHVKSAEWSVDLGQWSEDSFPVIVCMGKGFRVWEALLVSYQDLG